MRQQSKMDSRLIIVSNRGPYDLRVTKQGLKREKTVSGLVTSLLPMIEKLGGVWIARGDLAGRFPGRPGTPSFDLRYIQLSAEQLQGFYYGLANSALWPLCHYFLGRAHYSDDEWQTYQEVNRLYAQVTLEEAREEDVIWVQDYHLALVPCFIRQERPSARIAFFWHIPFPAPEVFRTLPWREEFLSCMLACDLVGFHIPEYAENFRETVTDVLGARVDGEYIYYSGRMTRVMARPIGIDYRWVSETAHARVTDERVKNLRQTLAGQTLIFGVERLDYTKGIYERLQAMENILERAPDLQGKVCLIQIVTPSRARVKAYRQRKREIDELVGRINGRFSDGIWMPIRYLYRRISPTELVAYYRTSDIALVTPLRDGLNLVAKEYVVSRIDGDGVLILSEFAGVAYQLPEALLVNPYSVEDIAKALLHALKMPKEEQRRRMSAMQARIKSQDIFWWAQEFLERMSEIAMPVESQLVPFNVPV